MKYTIVILTKNENDIISKCLDAIPYGVDCFVLDSGSTDGTKETVLSKGFHYSEHLMSEFIISEQRNWALRNLEIKTEWVLFLDADEYISNELHEKILSVIENGTFNAYRLNPKFIFWGKWMKRLQGYPNWHDRLLKKDEVSIVGGVWESFDQSAKVGYIDIPYDHHANIKGFKYWLEKHDRYSSWDAQNTYKFLYEGKEFSTTRKVRMRRMAARLWWIRPWGRCFYMYFIRLGFLEGWRAFYLVLLYFIYEYMIVIKIIELKRLNSHKDL